MSGRLGGVFTLPSRGNAPTTVELVDSQVVLAPEGNTGTVYFEFLAVRTGRLSGASSVDWAVTGSTHPGAAADGGDFVGGVFPTGTLSFGVGETFKSILVPVQGDTTEEVDKGFKLTISNPIGTLLGNIRDAYGTIVNDDTVPTPAPTLAISADTAQLWEGNTGTTNFIFSVTRSGDLSGTSSASWTVTGADADDFIGGVRPTGTVSFAANESVKTITVGVAGDTLEEPDQQFTITLSSPVGCTIATPQAIATILNDDLPGGGTPPGGLSFESDWEVDPARGGWVEKAGNISPSGAVGNPPGSTPLAVVVAAGDSPWPETTGELAFLSRMPGINESDYLDSTIFLAWSTRIPSGYLGQAGLNEWATVLALRGDPRMRAPWPLRLMAGQEDDGQVRWLLARNFGNLASGNAPVVSRPNAGMEAVRENVWRSFVLKLTYSRTEGEARLFVRDEDWAADDWREALAYAGPTVQWDSRGSLAGFGLPSLPPNALGETFFCQGYHRSGGQAWTETVYHSAKLVRADTLDLAKYEAFGQGGVVDPPTGERTRFFLDSTSLAAYPSELSLVAVPSGQVLDIGQAPNPASPRQTFRRFTSGRVPAGGLVINGVLNFGVQGNWVQGAASAASAPRFFARLWKRNALNTTFTEIGLWSDDGPVAAGWGLHSWSGNVNVELLEDERLALDVGIEQNGQAMGGEWVSLDVGGLEGSGDFGFLEFPLAPGFKAEEATGGGGELPPPGGAEEGLLWSSAFDGISIGSINVDGNRPLNGTDSVTGKSWQAMPFAGRAEVFVLADGTNNRIIDTVGPDGLACKAFRMQVTAGHGDSNWQTSIGHFPASADQTPFFVRFWARFPEDPRDQMIENPTTPSNGIWTNWRAFTAFKTGTPTGRNTSQNGDFRCGIGIRKYSRSDLRWIVNADANANGGAPAASYYSKEFNHIPIPFGNQWFKVEQWIDRGTPGQNDGTWIVWINGQELFTYHGRMWGIWNSPFNRLWYETYSAANMPVSLDLTKMEYWDRIPGVTEAPTGGGGEEPPPEVPTNYYLDSTASAVSGFKKLADAASHVLEDIGASPDGSVEMLLGSFASNRMPAGGQTLAGTVSFTFFCNWIQGSAGAGEAPKVRVKLAKRQPGGTEAAVVTVDDDAAISTTFGAHSFSGTIPETLFAEDDRLVARVYLAHASGMGGDWVTLDIGGDESDGDYARVTLPQNVAFKVD